ncbi:MAG: hypothetical protein ACHQ7M_17330 [Chloroflexota bacterium]
MVEARQPVDAGQVIGVEAMAQAQYEGETNKWQWREAADVFQPKHVIILVDLVDPSVAGRAHTPPAWINAVRGPKDEAATQTPAAKSVTSDQCMDSSLVKELEDSGFIKQIYG